MATIELIILVIMSADDTNTNHLS